MTEERKHQEGSVRVLCYFCTIIRFLAWLGNVIPVLYLEGIFHHAR